MDFTTGSNSRSPEAWILARTQGCAKAGEAPGAGRPCRAVTEVPRLGAERGVAQDGPGREAAGRCRQACSQGAGRTQAGRPGLAAPLTPAPPDPERQRHNLWRLACSWARRGGAKARAPASNADPWSRRLRRGGAWRPGAHPNEASVAGDRRRGGRGGPSAAALTAAAEGQGSTE